ncbi:hypothetical protein FKM82_018629 [Ascaphus truei]
MIQMKLKKIQSVAKSDIKISSLDVTTEGKVVKTMERVVPTEFTVDKSDVTVCETKSKIHFPHFQMPKIGFGTTVSTDDDSIEKTER